MASLQAIRAAVGPNTALRGHLIGATSVAAAGTAVGAVRGATSDYESELSEFGDMAAAMIAFGAAASLATGAPKIWRFARTPIVDHVARPTASQVARRVGSELAFGAGVGALASASMIGATSIASHVAN